MIETFQNLGHGFSVALAPTMLFFGYTLLLALSSISIIPEADKLFGRQPAYTVDQFAPIALISADPTILVVRAESPWVVFSPDG